MHLAVLAGSKDVLKLLNSAGANMSAQVFYYFQHSSVNPLHPSISMNILQTVLYRFPKVLTRRICLKIKSFFSW